MLRDHFTLNPNAVLETGEALERRIFERFPRSGLGQVCTDLVATIRIAHERAGWIQRPLVTVRIAAAIIFVGLTLFAVILAANLPSSESGRTWQELLSILDSGSNTFLFFGGIFLFVGTLENRVKRRYSLGELHRLRSLAHIIDMHQLTKDPDRVTTTLLATPSSPKVSLTPVELRRYLDYCSEMLALIGKIAAIYAQNLEDPQILEAVNDIEQLTTNLSLKVWQKLRILHAL